MHFFCLQTVEFGRPPTELEIEKDLATAKKSRPQQSSSSRGTMRNARARNKGVEEVRSELYSFQESVKGQLSDMSALVKELLCEVRKQNGGGTYPSSSQVGTMVANEGAAKEVVEELLVASAPDVVESQKETPQNPLAVNMSKAMVIVQAPHHHMCS